MHTTPRRHAHTSPHIALLIALLTLLALTHVACSSSNTNNQNTEAMRKLAQTYPGHDLFIPEDVEMVVRINALGDRLSKVAKSKAYAKLVEYITKTNQDDPELSSLLRSLQSDTPAILNLLNTKTSLIFYKLPKEDTPGAPTGPAPPSKTPGIRTISNVVPDVVPANDVPRQMIQAEEDFAIVVDGNVAELVVGLMEMVEPERPPGDLQRKDIGQGITTFQMDDSEEELYTFQAGPIGIIAPNKTALQKTISMRANAAQRRLSQSKLYAQMAQKMPTQPDISIYLRDWTESSDSWSGMITQDPNKTPSPALGSISLKDGVDLQFVFQTNDDSFEDPSTRALLQNITTSGPPPSATIQNILPSNTLLYFNVNIPQQALKKTIVQSTLDGDLPPQANSMLQALADTLSGEFAVVVTSDPSGKAQTRMGMYALPEAALIARLASPDKEPQLAKMLDAAISLVAQDAAPTPGDPNSAILGARRTANIGGAEATLFSTEIPGVDIGYIFHKGHLVIGTEPSLRHIAARPASVPLLGKVQLNPIVTKSFQTPSHYTLHTDLLAVYEFVRNNYGPFLTVLGFDTASPNDPIFTAVSVARFLGGNISFSDNLMNFKMHLTIQDLP